VRCRNVVCWRSAGVELIPRGNPTTCLLLFQWFEGEKFLPALRVSAICCERFPAWVVGRQARVRPRRFGGAGLTTRHTPKLPVYNSTHVRSPRIKWWVTDTTPGEFRICFT